MGGSCGTGRGAVEIFGSMSAPVSAFTAFPPPGGGESETALAEPNALRALQARDQLLRRLADLAIFPPGRLTPHERALVGSVMAIAVSRLDVAQRRRLAERIAELPEGPRELAAALAADVIEVAEPLLREGLGLDESDIVHIIRETGPAHRLAIAGRKVLTAGMVDALMDYGDTRIICRMLENSAAGIPMRAMETLVRRSAMEPEFLPLLLARPDLTVRLAQLMFWWAPAHLRMEILGRFSVERRMMHEALREVLDAGLAASAGDEGLRVALSLVRPPVAIEKAEFMHLLNFATLGRNEEFMAELAAAARIRAETVFRILHDPGGEPLAVFGKAIGLARKEFGDLIVAAAELRAAALPLKGDIERITSIFDAISTDRADLVLHCWDHAISGEGQILFPDETGFRETA
jgi:uncharacterized protein (DUF2336 family)